MGRVSHRSVTIVVVSCVLGITLRNLIFVPPNNSIELVISTQDPDSPTSPYPHISHDDYFAEDDQLDLVDDIVDTVQVQEERQPPPLGDHYYGDDGLLVVNPNGRHPILDLMERAEEAWSKKLGRASKTLPEAVAEYKRRYHRPPPIHFDKWYVVSMETKFKRAS